MSRFLLVLLLAACDGEVVSETSPVQPPVAVAPAPKPVEPAVLPAYDESLDSPEEIEAWRTETLAVLAEHVLLPDPDAVDAKYAVHFKVTAESLALEVGDTKEWDVGYNPHVPPATPAKKPTAAEAARLEAGDEEFAAGLAYVALGDKAAARRCLSALKDEVEWNAVATLALALGDEEELHAALDVLVADGRDDLVVSVVGDAIAAGKSDRALALAKKYEVDLGSDELYDTILARALAGDAKMLVPYVEKQAERWATLSADSPAEVMTSYDAFGHWVPSVELVVLAAKSDKNAALELARGYLADPRFNAVAWLHCGEGCGTVPVSGTVELYQLAKTDPELKAAYLARVRGWGAVAFKDEYVEWDGDTLGALMAKVRKTKDADLIKAWDDALQPSGEDAGFVNFLRSVLGLPGSVANLDPYSYGKISVADLRKLWIAFEFPVAPATPRYAASRFEEALATADALYASEKSEEADRVYVALLRSGWKPAPNDVPAVDTQRPTELMLALAEAGYPDAALEEVVARIGQDVIEARDGRWLSGEAVIEFLGRPETVRMANEAADAAREGNAGTDKPRGISPHTYAQTNDIVAPVVAVLRAKAPALYERYLLERNAHGDTALYDAELAARNAAGDLAGVQRLAGIPAPE